MSSSTSPSPPGEESFAVNLSHRGRTVVLRGVTTATTGGELLEMAHEALGLSPRDCALKLLLKGRRICADGDGDGDDSPVFAAPPAPNGKAPPKILVMSTSRNTVDEMNAKKSDPLIRGFDQEEERRRKKKASSTAKSYWGPLSEPDRNYKFCRIEECPFHSFGHRPTDSTPHAFRARELLERLASDPGIVAVMKERELVVATLGEMDPIDDRIMQKKQQQQQGSCLLGYNTNRGLRIDVKLRADDLSEGFRPYPELVSTLIHELSHNWVGEHDALFWANYGQMRVEYLVAHMRMRSALHMGKTSAELAGLTSSSPSLFRGGGGGDNDNGVVVAFVMEELRREMAQHRLPADLVAEPVRQRYEELMREPSPSSSSLLGGQRLGGSGTTGESASTTAQGGSKNKRNLALEAAERRRAREHQQQQQQQKETEGE